MNSTLYVLSSVAKYVTTSEEETLCIIKDITCTIERGESIAILGASGSGKSTLLHLLGLLDTPTSGTIHYNSIDTKTMTIEERAGFHRKEIGFVFQFHHLLSEFTAIENIAIHAQLAGYTESESKEMSIEALKRVGLVHKGKDRVTTLSGGEKQRVSIARAIVTNPRVILADEPTGSLDTGTAEQIIDVLQTLQNESGTTLILVTHNTHLASCMDRRFVLDMGGLRDA